MNTTFRFVVALGLLLALTTGCGDDAEPTFEGSAPTIETLSYSPTTVTAGQTATITGALTVRDEDGDVRYWRARVVGPSGQELTTGDKAISGNLGTLGELQFSLQIPQPEAGSHTFYVAVIDSDERVSNELSGTFTAE